MLLRQAKQENIVTYLSNLYDTFFEGGKDHRVDKPSVLHLPYFEGNFSQHTFALLSAFQHYLHTLTAQTGADA